MTSNVSPKGNEAAEIEGLKHHWRHPATCPNKKTWFESHFLFSNGF